MALEPRFRRFDTYNPLVPRPTGGRVFDSYPTLEFQDKVQTMTCMSGGPFTLKKTSGATAPDEVTEVNSVFLNNHYTMAAFAISKPRANFFNAEVVMQGGSSNFYVKRLLALVVEQPLVPVDVDNTAVRWYYKDFGEVTIANVNTYFYAKLPLWSFTGGMLSVWFSAWEAGSAVTINHIAVTMQAVA